MTTTHSNGHAEWPRISIVTVNLNQGDYLEQTIKSVLAQDYPNLEYIVIDGGSTDGSKDIIARNAPKLSYHCSEPDEGHYHAVNKGFARATGEILGFLNSDDKYFPGALRMVGEVFAQHRAIDWLASLQPALWDLAGNCISVGQMAGYSRAAFLDDCYGGASRLKIGPIQQESTFWRRTLWDASGGALRTAYSHAADFDLWGRFYQHAELYGLAAPLGGFRMRAGQRGGGGGGDVYLRQRAEILQEARRTLRWHPSRLRNVAVAAHLHEVPKLRTILRRKLGYPAKRVVRDAPGTAHESWLVQDYRFL